MSPEYEYTELVRIGDPIQADLLAAFLEDGDLHFQIINRHSAGFMANLVPREANPVIFKVLEPDMEQGNTLLLEYRKLQNAELIPSEIPPPPED